MRWRYLTDAYVRWAGLEVVPARLPRDQRVTVGTATYLSPQRREFVPAVLFDGMYYVRDHGAWLASWPAGSERRG